MRQGIPFDVRYLLRNALAEWVHDQVEGQLNHLISYQLDNNIPEQTLFLEYDTSLKDGKFYMTLVSSGMRDRE